MRTIVDLPDAHIEALKLLGEQSRLSRSELVRRAVAEYLLDHSPKGKEEAFGIWSGNPRDGLDLQRTLREEWDA